MFSNMKSPIENLLIKYSENEYKLLPILEPLANGSLSPEAFHYYVVMHVPRGVALLTNIKPSVAEISTHKLEKCLHRYLESVSLEEKELGQWFWNLKIRDLVVAEKVYSNLQKMQYFESISK